MELIENNAGTITENILLEVQKHDEVKHYQELPEGVARERINQVIRNVYERLGNWLSKNKSKDTLFAYYFHLGAERCREGIPLEEVVMLFMLIKREIWYVIGDGIAVGSGFPLKEINYYGNLFFDRIVHSTIAGYQAELGKVCETGSDKDLVGKIFGK
jgi:hypothetical protein